MSYHLFPASSNSGGVPPTSFPYPANMNAPQTPPMENKRKASDHGDSGENVTPDHKRFKPGTFATLTPMTGHPMFEMPNMQLPSFGMQRPPTPPQPTFGTFSSLLGGYDLSGSQAAQRQPTDRSYSPFQGTTYRETPLHHNQQRAAAGPLANVPDTITNAPRQPNHKAEPAGFLDLGDIDSHYLVLPSDEDDDAEIDIIQNPHLSPYYQSQANGASGAGHTPFIPSASSDPNDFQLTWQNEDIFNDERSMSRKAGHRVPRPRDNENDQLQALIDAMDDDEGAPTGVDTQRSRLIRGKDRDGNKAVQSSPEAIKKDQDKIYAAARILRLQKYRDRKERRVEIEDTPENPEDDESEMGLTRPALGPEKSKDGMEWISGVDIGHTENNKKYKIVYEYDHVFKLSGFKKDSRLLRHQVLWLDWAIKHETSSDVRKKVGHGGIVADQMGLGKTVEMLALMVQNAPTKDAKAKTTLIVCPSSLLLQWLSEIRKHVIDGVFKKVGIHHTKNKLTKKEMEDYDVVLTTYGMVQHSCPSLKKPESMKKEDWEEKWEQRWEEKRGVLHRVKFFRICLDEAHIIKNRHGQQSRAVRKLEGIHKWPMTGTPIPNSLEDVYPLLDFIQHPQCESFEGYRERFLDGGSVTKRLIDRTRSAQDQAKRVGVLLKGCMIRRLKTDVIMGKEIIHLEQKHMTMVMLEPTREERFFYVAIEAAFRGRINELLEEAGDNQAAMQQMRSFVLAMLVRLRTLCNHPVLARTCLGKWLSIGDVEALVEKITSDIPAPVLRGMDDKGAPDDAGEEPENEDTPIAPLPTAEEDIKSNADLTHWLEQVVADGNRDGRFNFVEEECRPCEICSENPANPVQSGRCRCPCIFCTECITNHIDAMTGSGQSAKCPDCGKPIDAENLKAIKVKSKPTQSTAEYLNTISIYDSTKTKAVFAQIQEWRRSQPGSKVVLFSQFTSMLDVLEKMLVEEGEVVFCRYDGSMSHEERNNAVVQFTTNPQMMIMLTSLKAGGVGLNLVAANLVLSLDLWWNVAPEQQAFDRVHRIGQLKEVYIVRFMLKGTVEEKLFAKQKEKESISQTAMGEKGDWNKQGKMSMQDILSLFGRVTYQDGHMRLEGEGDQPAQNGGARSGAKGLPAIGV